MLIAVKWEQKPRTRYAVDGFRLKNPSSQGLSRFLQLFPKAKSERTATLKIAAELGYKLDQVLIGFLNRGLIPKLKEGL